MALIGTYPARIRNHVPVEEAAGLPVAKGTRRRSVLGWGTNQQHRQGIRPTVGVCWSCWMQDGEPCGYAETLGAMALTLRTETHGSKGRE